MKDHNYCYYLILTFWVPSLWTYTNDCSTVLYPIEPKFIDSESILLWCEIGSNCDVKDLHFKMDSDRETEKQGILRQNSKTFNLTTLQVKFVVDTTWHKKQIDCCYKDRCLSQEMLRVGYPPPVPIITEYKIYDGDLIFSWELSNSSSSSSSSSSSLDDDYYNINETAYYKGSLQGDFITCNEVTRKTCTVQHFYPNIFEYDVVLQVNATNFFGETQSQIVQGVAEEIIETKPLENITYLVQHGNGSSIGQVTLNFSVPEDVAANEPDVACVCVCDESSFQFQKSFRINSEQTTYHLEDLPADLPCHCSLRIKEGLGRWSKETVVSFRSPQNVPLRNPIIIGYEVSISMKEYIEVTLLFETLKKNESRGQLKHYKLLIKISGTCLPIRLISNNININNNNNNNINNNNDNNCSVSVESGPFIKFAYNNSNSNNINNDKLVEIIFYSENDAGPCLSKDQFYINIDQTNYFHNLTAVQINRNLTRLYWSIDTSLSSSPSTSSLVIVWCFMDCQELEWETVTTTSTTYDVVTGQDLKFGIGKKTEVDLIPKIVWTDAVCYNKDSPLPMLLTLDLLSGKTAHINYHVPHCNRSGVAYKHIFYLKSVDATNETKIVEEKHLDPDSFDGIITFELPDTRYSYQINSLSISQGGTMLSNPVMVKYNSDSISLWFLLFLLVPLLVFLFIGIVKFYKFYKKEKSCKIGIDIPLNLSKLLPDGYSHSNTRDQENAEFITTMNVDPNSLSIRIEDEDGSQLPRLGLNSSIINIINDDDDDDDGNGDEREEINENKHNEDGGGDGSSGDDYGCAGNSGVIDDYSKCCRSRNGVGESDDSGGVGSREEIDNHIDDGDDDDDDDDSNSGEIDEYSKASKRYNDISFDSPPKNICVDIKNQYDNDDIEGVGNGKNDSGYGGVAGVAGVNNVDSFELQNYSKVTMNE